MKALDNLVMFNCIQCYRQNTYFVREGINEKMASFGPKEIAEHHILVRDNNLLKFHRFHVKRLHATSFTMRQTSVSLLPGQYG